MWLCIVHISKTIKDLKLEVLVIVKCELYNVSSIYKKIIVNLRIIYIEFSALSELFAMINSELKRKKNVFSEQF